MFSAPPVWHLSWRDAAVTFPAAVSTASLPFPSQYSCIRRNDWNEPRASSSKTHLAKINHSLNVFSETVSQSSCQTRPQLLVQATPTPVTVFGHRSTQPPANHHIYIARITLLHNLCVVLFYTALVPLPESLYKSPLPSFVRLPVLSIFHRTLPFTLYRFNKILNAFSAD